MTLNVEVPVISYKGDGVKVLYTFDFSLTEEEDVYVRINNVLVTEFSEYTVQNVTTTGGEILFAEAPADGTIIVISRDTDKSQQVDYIQYAAFPAETHEAELDKIVRILQELINGTFIGYDEDGNQVFLSFDLEGVAQLTTVDITNSGGTDAAIPVWVSGTLAGVYIGETSLEANIPADGAATSQPDGYVWLGV